MGSVLSKRFLSSRDSYRPTANAHLLLLTDLPDLIQRTILAQLTPSEQLLARQVCLKWHQLMPTVARQVHSLTLVIGAPSSNSHLTRCMSDITKNALAVPATMQRLTDETGKRIYTVDLLLEPGKYLFCFDERRLEAITSTFTNITELQVALIGRLPKSSFKKLLGSLFKKRNTDELPNETLVYWLVSFLVAWGHQLTTLKLYERECPISVEATSASLFTAINSLNRLKHLTIFFDYLPEQELSILSQLESVRYNNQFNDPELFLGMLAKYGEANAHLTIEYCNSGFNDILNMGSFRALSSSLRGRFTRYVVNCPYFPYSFTVHNLPSLRSLKIIVCGISIEQLFRQLSQLTQLIHLQLVTPFGMVMEGNIDDEQWNQLPQLKSIKALELLLSVYSNPEEFQLASTMPNLEVLSFHVPSTRFFGIGPCDRGTEKLLAQEVFLPLKQSCPKLHTIMHLYEDLETYFGEGLN